jgi:hypothetical protein
LPGVYAEGTLYYSPIFSVREMMQRIEERYLTEKEASLRSGSEEQFAQALARYYLDGISIVHPFQDGNDRPYQLVLEREWSATGNRLVLPADNRGKIPLSIPVGMMSTVYTAGSAELLRLPIGDGSFHFQYMLDPNRTQKMQAGANTILNYLESPQQIPALAHIVNEFASGLRSYSRA